ncbi:hypothetical protein L6452_32102 [Arctium lappa]|uniref:Uncharacterized protein n=1 Tax=Arctium lappa TaxID=4217 RepID=A0ACB8Z403_ARCLA|nr:hypothetical protein L6452_32102 [Arctium lappa]
MSSKEENVKLKAKIVSLVEKIVQKRESYHKTLAGYVYQINCHEKEWNEQISSIKKYNEWLHLHIADLKKAISSGSYSEFFVEYKKQIKELKREIIKALKSDKWLEVEKFGQDKIKMVEEKAKALEAENAELKKQLLEIEEDSTKKSEVKSKNVEKGFEELRNIFETEIKKLTRKLSELSTKAMKEQNMKSEFQKKIDQLTKERNSLSSKIKELEEIFSKVVLTEHKTPDSILQTPRDDSVDSECSIKTSSSSHHKTVSTKRLVNSKDQISTTNLFYDRNVDGSGTFRRRNGYEKFVWRVKAASDEKNDQKSFVHTPIAKKKIVHKILLITGTSSLGGVKELWLLDNTVQDPFFNVKEFDF